MIGVFDSGVGGLTVLKDIRQTMPQYATLYLGDNAHAPYGDKTPKEIYTHTKKAVEYLFREGCPLVILACNTATAHALQRLQRELTPQDGVRRILGVIRPTEEFLAHKGYRSVGVLATEATVTSGAYDRESKHIPDGMAVAMQACPTWVPYIESGADLSKAQRRQIQKDVESLLAQDKNISAVILGCTHYPALASVIRGLLPEGIELFSQGEIVAQSLKKYLAAHPEIEHRLTTGHQVMYRTTGDPEHVAKIAQTLMGEDVVFQHVELG